MAVPDGRRGPADDPAAGRLHRAAALLRARRDGGLGQGVATEGFPEGFLFGAAAGAHQIEGGNVNSDWWAWEHAAGTPCVEPSGDAVDFYHRYAEDVQLLSDLGLTAFRFSLEWARIEPADGEFSEAELDHYRRVLDACRDRGITPFLTFHHFTLPRWVQERGGFESGRFPELFERYCEHTAALARLAGYAATLNEPESLAQGGYVLGVNPPGRRHDVGAMWRVTDNLLAAHERGRAAIRAAAPGVPTGVTLALTDLRYEDGARPGELLPELSRRISERFLELARADDYVGVQTYTRIRIGPEGIRSPSVRWADTGHLAPETETTSQMGYELYPPALAATVRLAAAATGRPVVVSENGIATLDDGKRIRFLGESLDQVRRCLAEGIDVRGYFYWTLLDNFEWAFGYAPRFGLVAVDRRSFARTPKPSARWYGQVAQSSKVVG